MNIPYISIIIPVYNTERFLLRCLTSCIKQTYPNIEIIIVNDCSSDNSEAIILDCQQKDKRIKYLKNDANKGTHYSRWQAIDQAVGEYILFLDSDDEISLNTCEKILKETQKKKIDILQMSYYFISKNSIYTEKPYFNILKDEECFEGMFINKTYGSWSIGGKVVHKDILKKGLSYIPRNVYLYFAEDYLLFFIVGYFAKSIHSLSESFYSYYQHSNSVTSVKFFDSNKINKFISNTKELMNIYRNFKNEFNIDQKYPYICNEKQLYFVLVFEFFHKIPHQKQKQYFEKFCNALGVENVFDVFSNYAYLPKLAPLISKNHKNLRPVKNIAIFVQKLSDGGVEHETSILTRHLSDMGYNIIIVTNEDPTSNDYDFTSAQSIIVVDHRQRFTSINKIIAQYNIDTVLIQNFYQTNSYYELAYFNYRKDINTVFKIHNTSLWFEYQHKASKWEYSFLLPLADVLGVLSIYDKIYLENTVAPCIYLPNLLTIEPKTIPCNLLNTNRILFIGRLEPQKKPIQLIYIMAEVVKKIPNAHLDIVGDGSCYQEMEELINDLALENNITMHGYHTDARVFLKHAHIHLMPSLFEGMPLVLNEAKAYGIPSVISNMFYLEAFKYPGVEIVEHDNIHDYADKILKLFTDHEYCKKKGKEARESLEYFKSETTLQLWQNIFDHFANNDISLLLEPIKTENIEKILQQYNEARIFQLSLYDQIIFANPDALSPPKHTKLFKIIKIIKIAIKEILAQLTIKK